MTMAQLDERFAEWVDDRLAPGELVQLQDELANDRRLQRAAAEYRATVELVRRGLGGDERAPDELVPAVMQATSGDAGRSGWGGWIALLAAACLVVYLARQGAEPAPSEPMRVGRAEDGDRGMEEREPAAKVAAPAFEGAVRQHEAPSAPPSPATSPDSSQLLRRLRVAFGAGAGGRPTGPDSDTFGGKRGGARQLEKKAPPERRRALVLLVSGPAEATKGAGEVPAPNAGARTERRPSSPGAWLRAPALLGTGGARLALAFHPVRLPPARPADTPAEDKRIAGSYAPGPRDQGLLIRGPAAQISTYVERLQRTLAREGRSLDLLWGSAALHEIAREVAEQAPRLATRNRTTPKTRGEPEKDAANEENAELLLVLREAANPSGKGK